MVVGAVIAIVLGAIGVPWPLALGVGVIYFLVALRMTPRSAYVGGLFGPKPRQGEIAGPGSLREIDLTPSDLEAMNRHNRERLPELAAELREELGLNLRDLEYGNIGRHQGQFAAFVFEVPDGYAEATLSRGRAINVVTSMLAPQHDDVREARISFVNSAGKRVAESVVDLSAAFAIGDPGDQEAVAAYASAHTRSREFD